MEWTTIHPGAHGDYWVSVEPSKRNPAPWVTLPSVFIIRIKLNGEVWEMGNNAPTYTLDSIPEACLSGVKYARCDPPPDPWSPS